MAIHDLTASLDLKQNLNIFANCKQFDSLNLILSIFDNSVQADLTNYNVRLKAMKADKVPLIQEHIGIIINSNTVNIEADEQLTTTAGKMPIEVQFINKTTGKKKATFNLILKVVSSTIEIDRTISTATYTLLEELENKLDQAGDFFENIDKAIESNTNLIATNATANKNKTDLDLSNTNATNTKNSLDESKTNADNSKKALDAANILAATNTNNLDVANVQAVKNYDALNQLGDATNLAKKVQENTIQLSQSVKEINIVKTDYAKKTDVNILASSKAENSVVQALQTQVNSVASGSPKNVFATLALLQADTIANTTEGKKYIYVVTTDGKWYFWNGSAWTVGGTYQSTMISDLSITTPKIASNSITSDKLGNGTLRLIQPSILATSFTNGSFISWVDGTLQANEIYSYSDYIPLIPNSTYTNSMPTNYSIYDSSHNFILGVHEIGVVTTSPPFTVPANGAYIRVSVHTTDKTNYSLFIGDTTTGNVLTHYIIPSSIDGKKVCFQDEMILNSLEDNSVDASKLIDGTVTPQKCSKLIVKYEKSKNLFNKNAVTLGCFINWNNGTIQANADYDASDWMELTPNTTYVQSWNTHFALYDKNKNFTRGFQDSANPTTITTTSNEYYIRISIKLTQYDINNYQLEKGTTPTTVSPFGYIVDNKVDNVEVYFPSIAQYDKIKNSRFFGKKVSWYGTSITQGYAWCSLVNTAFNFRATNNGVGGTAICNENQYSSMCNTERMLGKYSNVTDSNTGQVTYNGVPIPTDVEVIFIEGGTNDWARNWTIGTEKFSQTPNDKEFYGACDKMFRNITALFPNPEIIIVGSPFGKMANRGVFTDKYGVLNNQNLQTIEYGDMLLEVAGRWGFKGINIGRLMQINDNNIATLVPDGLHLTTAEAQKRASDAIISYLLSLN